jgi:hypothetical protein
MAGQLCWIPKAGSTGQLCLHLRLAPHQPWKPHTAFPHLCVRDYPIPGGSSGWATSQKLIGAGWQIIPTEQAKVSIDTPAPSLANVAFFPDRSSLDERQYG